MKQRIEALLKRPAIAHIVRAGTRYGERNGTLLAAAITYRSMLTLVPILMLFFSLIGMFVTVFWPHLLDSMEKWLESYFDAGMMKQYVMPILQTYFTGFGWATITALGVAIWTGTGWIGALRDAIQVELADDVRKSTHESRNPIIVTISNMVTFIVFILVTIGTFALSVLTSTFNRHLVGWLGLENTPGIGLVVQVVGMAVTAVAGTLMFLFLFWALSERRLPTLQWVIGSAFAGVALMVMQSLTGILTQSFSRNLSASIFGSWIVVMLFFNLYATLIMMTAAWIGTAQPEPEKAEEHAPADHAEVIIPIRGPEPARAPSRELSDPLIHIPAPDPNILIPQDVAAKSVRVGATFGYGLGAVTGLGIGTFLASLLKGLFRRC